MRADDGNQSRKRADGGGPASTSAAVRALELVLLARQFAKAALPSSVRNRIRRGLAPFVGRNILARRLLGEGGRPYRYRAPQRPQNLAGMALDVHFSIVTPAGRAPPALLNAMTRSVQNQWHPHWELIVAADSGASPGARKVLEGISDPRVKLLFSEDNSGVSQAINRAIAAATGDYIVFLDEGDELTIDCLHELALAIRDTDADYLYSDEDQLALRDRHFKPYFKPDWSPDTLMSIMYTRHVGCVRRSVLEQTGPLRPAFDGNQDWDLALRITEKTQRIVHISKVLYHCRASLEPGAGCKNVKAQAIDAGKRAREAALARRGVSGVLEPVLEAAGHFRVRPHIQGSPLISIIIPSKNNGRVLGACLDSIRKNSSYTNVEIVVLDNGSTDPATLDMLQAERGKGVIIICHDAPFNYSGLNNLGVRHAAGELLLFLNDDTEVISADWLERMAGFAQLPHIGAVGAKLLYPQTRGVQHVGVINAGPGPTHALLHEKATSPGYFMRNLLEHNWLAVTGACLMLSRTKFNEIGGFNEMLPVAYNDVDLCFRLHAAGYYNIVATAAQLLHHESISRGDDLADPVKRARLAADGKKLYEAHPALRGRDPFYNPNLNPNGVHFEYGN